MDKPLSFKVLPQLLLLLASTATTTWLVTHEYYTPAAVLAAITIITIVGIIWFYNQNIRKLMFLFDSIENGEYAFQFTKTKRYRHNALINQSLNHVRQLLARARDETIEQEKYYQLILESVTTGIMVVNDYGHVFQTNREAIRLLGIEPLTHVSQLSALDDRLPGLAREIVAGESRQLTYNTERESVTLSLHASTIVRNGETLKIITLSDIETELSDREIESWLRLIRVLTHEIMNAMGPITSISESLVAQITETENRQIRHGLLTINETSKNLTSFVDSYRKFTRIPAPEPTLFYLCEFMESLRALALSTATESGRDIELTVSTQPDDLILYADRGLVSQVALNLLKNAIEATATTERARIAFSAVIDPREQVIITIEDNGPGISQEVADHIFIPFFTTKTGGSGVGLSLSRQIMRLHGGTLNYKNATRGTGSIFTLTFK